MQGTERIVLTFLHLTPGREQFSFKIVLANQQSQKKGVRGEQNKIKIQDQDGFKSKFNPFLMV